MNDLPDPQSVETVVIGGGQAGLVTSYFLAQEGRSHVVLERAATAAPVWRTNRWDSFTTVTPNSVLRFPGAEYDGPDPDGFLSREEIVAHFDRYVTRFGLPIRYNTRAMAVEARDGGGFRVRTDEYVIETDNVVVAIGEEQSPKLPPGTVSLSPAIRQLHSSDYRNPASLPAGAVLVVGSGQSGSQIVEELYQHGRQVYFATGGSGRVPRRYRGKDVIDWLMQVGFFDLTPDRLPPGMKKFGGVPHVSGTNGGHTLNLHQFARDGVTLLGHIRGITEQTMTFAPDLHENLARADGFERNATRMIDEFIAAHGIDAPPEALPQLDDGFHQPVIETIDLLKAGIGSVIWATGFRFDYSLVKLPVFDADGYPIQQTGVTDVRGLYFVGIPWMPSIKSGSFMGFTECCKHVASHILASAGVSMGVPERRAQAVAAS